VLLRVVAWLDQRSIPMERTGNSGGGRSLGPGVWGSGVGRSQFALQTTERGVKNKSEGSCDAWWFKLGMDSAWEKNPDKWAQTQ
jgi:hypothetical protein